MSGEWAIEPRFDAGDSFYDGLSPTLTGETEAYIDPEGDVVWSSQ